MKEQPNATLDEIVAVEEVEEESVADVEYEEGQLYHIPVDSLEFNPDQPRKHIDDDELENLRVSIESVGLLNPILFRQNESGELVVVAGERRVRAVVKNGGSTIQGMYFDGDHDEAALVENVIRVNLTPLEEAMGLQELKDKKGCTDEVIAGIVRKGRSTVAEILSLNNLPEVIKEICIKRRDLPRRELLKIVRTRNPEKQMEKFEALVEKHDAIASGEKPQRRPQNRDKCAVVEKMVQQLIQKITYIIEKWDKDEIQNIMLCIGGLKDELDGLESHLEFLETGISEGNRL